MTKFPPSSKSNFNPRFPRAGRFTIPHGAVTVKDTVPAMLRPGEGVLVPEATAMVGGARGINAMNRAAEARFPRRPQHFTEGGVAQDIGIDIPPADMNPGVDPYDTPNAPYWGLNDWFGINNSPYGQVGGPFPYDQMPDGGGKPYTMGNVSDAGPNSGPMGKYDPGFGYGNPVGGGHKYYSLGGVPAPGGLGGIYGAGSHGDIGWNYFGNMALKRMMHGGDPTLGWGAFAGRSGRILPVGNWGGAGFVGKSKIGTGAGTQLFTSNQ